MTFASDDYTAPDEALSDEPVASTDDLGGRARWYAVQVASGCERKVKASAEQRLLTLDLDNKVLQIEIPQVPILKPQKSGKPKEMPEKVFPGYVLVKIRLTEWNELRNRWEMDKHVWQAVKSTPNVINFVGSEQRRGTGRVRGHVEPMPLSAAEVKRIFKQTQEQKPAVKIDMAAGDKILVLSGPFKDFEGEVIEVSPERSKLKALLSIFGRDTPVELEFNQVQKES